MKIFKKLQHGFLVLATSLTTSAALASSSAGGTAIADDAFDDFEATLISWVNGPLGIGLAVASLLLGGGAGLMRNSPMPALAGLGLAAFFAWGPGIIVTIISDGAGSLV